MYILYVYIIFSKPNVSSFKDEWTSGCTSKMCRLVYRVLRNFKQYVSYTVAVIYSFIGGGNQNTRRKPPICRKSLTNFFTQ